jgi:hypothetical protein
VDAIARRVVELPEEGRTRAEGTPPGAEAGSACLTVSQVAARYDDDELLTVADAAHVARRSVRTLRRAYLSGKLTAHRDGNGRGVSIRYGDLRSWLTAEVIAPAPAVTPSRASARAGLRGRTDADVETGNAKLLTAALKRSRKRARASATPRPVRRWSGVG